MAEKNGKQFNCKSCDKEFYRSGWDIRNRRTSYCSVTCQYKGYQKRIELGCKQCGKLFIVAEYRKSTANFCSKDCTKRGVGLKTKKEKHWNWKGGKPKCLDCGKVIKYESKRCDQHKGIKGENNHFWGKRLVGKDSPSWISDRSLIKSREQRNNPEYKQWRFNVWLRDGFKCRIKNDNCDGRIETHHILGWKLYPELRYEINNGITLCHAHHPRKRAEEKRLAPIFQELVSVSKETL